MAADEDWFVHQLSVEVRYARGMVYLDRCGSTMNALTKELGPPFIGAVPQMHQAQLVSQVERLNVVYNADRLVVSQMWPENRARIEPTAKAAWKVVAEQLEVADQVVRLGVRSWLWLPVASSKEGHARLRNGGVIRATPQYEAVFGAPAGTGVVTLHELADGLHRRVSTEVVTLVAPAESLPRDLADRVPAHAIQLDIDTARAAEAGGTFKLGPGQLKDFIRSSIVEAQTQARALGTLLQESAPN